MNEDDILDVEQSFEPTEGSGQIGDSNIENDNTEIVLGAQALEDILTHPTEPFPVTIVEDEIEEVEIEPFALSGSYPGTISDTYLDYFEGIVQKLPFDTHYVIWRSGEYAYSLAYGESLEYSDDEFIGDCTVVDIYRDGTNYTNAWHIKYSEDTLSLMTGDLFVYSDLGHFSTVERGFSSLEAEVILFSIGFAVVFSICSSFFRYVLERLRR